MAMAAIGQNVGHAITEFPKARRWGTIGRVMNDQNLMASHFSSQSFVALIHF
jgi:hypothetical protein